MARGVFGRMGAQVRSFLNLNPAEVAQAESEIEDAINNVVDTPDEDEDEENQEVLEDFDPEDLMHPSLGRIMDLVEDATGKGRFPSLQKVMKEAKSAVRRERMDQDVKELSWEGSAWEAELNGLFKLAKSQVRNPSVSRQKRLKTKHKRVSQDAQALARAKAVAAIETAEAWQDAFIGDRERQSFKRRSRRLIAEVEAEATISRGLTAGSPKAIMADDAYELGSLLRGLLEAAGGKKKLKAKLKGLLDEESDLDELDVEDDDDDVIDVEVEKPAKKKAASKKSKDDESED